MEKTEQRLSKAEWIKLVRSKVGRKARPHVSEVFDKIFETIKEEVEDGNDLMLVNFGTFKCKVSPARTGRNIRTGELIPIPPRKKCVFVQSKGWKIES